MLIGELESRGFEVSPSSSIDDFLSEYGDLSNFEGILYNPGKLEQWRIKDIPIRFPSLKFAMVDLENGSRNGLPVFDYSNIHGIVNFFNSER